MNKKNYIDGVDVSECKHFSIDGMELCQIDFDNNYFSNGIPCAEKCSNHFNCYYKQLQRAKAELKKYKDMAKKGLEEFKDVGGCWGCGLQLQLNQDIEDIKQLKAENERLKQTLQEIREYCEEQNLKADYTACEILDLITKAEEE